VIEHPCTSVAPLPPCWLRRARAGKRRFVPAALERDAPTGRRTARQCRRTRIRLTLAQSARNVPQSTPTVRVRRMPRPASPFAGLGRRPQDAAPGRPNLVLGYEQLASAIEALPRPQDGERRRRIWQRAPAQAHRASMKCRTRRRNVRYRTLAAPALIVPAGRGLSISAGNGPWTAWVGSFLASRISKTLSATV
jgi:hypothetical protein